MAGQGDKTCPNRALHGHKLRLMHCCTPAYVASVADHVPSTSAHHCHALHVESSKIVVRSIVYSCALPSSGVAAMIELLAEPFYMLASVNMRFGVRVVMDSAPLAAKSLVQLAALGGYAGPVAQAAPPALIFAAAQLALAVVTLVGYAVFGVSELRRWRCGGAAAGAAGPPAAVAAGAGVAAAGAPAAVAATSRNGPKPKAGESASVDDEKEEVAAGEEGAEAGLRQRRGAAAGGTAAGNQSKAASGDSKDTRGSTQQGQEAKRVLGMWGPDEREAISTSAIFSLQAVEKLVLAEGSKAVLAGAASAYDAGGCTLWVHFIG